MFVKIKNKGVNYEKKSNNFGDGVLVSQLSFSNLVNDDKYRDIYGAYEGVSQLSFSNFVNDGD